MAVISSVERDGTIVLVEVDAAPADNLGYSSDHRGEALAKIKSSAKSLFAEGIGLIDTCAQEISDRMNSLGEIRPDEVTVQFAIKLDSEVGAILARASAGAQLQVSLKWAWEQK